MLLRHIADIYPNIINQHNEHVYESGYPFACVLLFATLRPLLEYYASKCFLSDYWCPSKWCQRSQQLCFRDMAQSICMCFCVYLGDTIILRKSQIMSSQVLAHVLLSSPLACRAPFAISDPSNGVLYQLHLK